MCAVLRMRLFVALQPSPVFRGALSELQNRLRVAGVEGRYLDPDNLHLTLAFIGEWPEDITLLLPAVDEPFSIVISHLGVFDRAKVLWVGIQPSEALNQLAARVRQRLDEAEIPFDHQAFNPHITLVRKPVQFGGKNYENVEVPPATMTVSEVCLYRSDHEADGMKYTVIGRAGGRV